RELREIFRLETERTISNDWVIRHKGRYLQLQPGNPRLWSYEKQGAGMRMGGWNDGGVLPRRADQVYGNIRVRTEDISIPRACPTGRCIAKSAERPPLAAGLQEHENLGSEDQDRNAARWNTHFRFALKTGLRFSAHSNDNLNPKKGDISIELR